MAGKGPKGAVSVDGTKTAFGFVLAGFAAIAGFLGVSSTEVSVILRNHETEALVVFFFLLASGLSALLSATTGKSHDGKAPQEGTKLRDHLLPGYLVLASIVLLFIAGCALIILFVPAQGSDYPAADHSVAVRVCLDIAFIAGSSGLVCALLASWGVPRRFAFRYSRDKQAQRLKAPVTVQTLLLLLSVLTLSASLLITFRLEARNQQTPNVQVVGTIEKTGQADEVAATVSTTRLTQTESLHISIVGYTSLSATNCYIQDTAAGCNIIGFWRVRPDETGAVQETLTELVPKSTIPFELVVGRAWMCGSGTYVKTKPHTTSTTTATTTTKTTSIPLGPQADSAVPQSTKTRTYMLNAHCSLIKAAGFELPLVEK
jgi:hypothetical protein